MSATKDLTISAGAVKGMLDFAIGQGANADILLRDSGIVRQALDDHDNRIPLKKYKTLVTRAKALCDDPLLSLHYAESTDMSDISIIGLICLASETMREAFKQVNRYGQLVTEVEGIGSGDRYELVRDNRGTWLVDRRKNPNSFPELTEGAFAFMVCGTRRFTRVQLVHEVQLTREPPEDTQEFERIFGTPVFYDRHWNAMLMDDAWLDFKVSQSPRYVFGILNEHADNLLQNLNASKSLRSTVESLLLPILHTGQLNMEKMANGLNMSRSTLFRKLKAEGESYDKILDSLRQRLALHYLESKKVSVNQTAYLLGFSDPSAFSRAFKRWTGMSPKTMLEQSKR